MTTEQYKHNVGDIIYVVKLKNAVVIPMQIAEITTKRTLQGVVTTYAALAAGPNAPVLLDPYASGDEVHVSPEDAYVSLVSRFETSIRKVVDTAIAASKQFQKPAE